MVSVSVVVGATVVEVVVDVVVEGEVVVVVASTIDCPNRRSCASV